LLPDPNQSSARDVAVIEATEQDSHTQSRLQAVSAADDQIVWASGLDGTVIRTEDGGVSWQPLRVPEAEELQFRDVHAFDSQLAYLLSAGDGELSRIYATRDGGTTWDLQFQNREPDGFLDCFDFWDAKRGIAYGDSIGGEFFVLATSDGGGSWARVPPATLPTAAEGEGGFAASGTCVRTGPGGVAWIGTGAGGSARVLRTSDWGQSWRVAKTPIVKGAAAGVMSVLLLDEEQGAALGGNLDDKSNRTTNVALSSDGGATWRSGGLLRFAGPAFGGAVGGSESRPLLVAAGPGGMDISRDRGETWHRLSDSDYWAVDFGGASRFWAVGPQGRITRFDAPDGESAVPRAAR